MRFFSGFEALYAQNDVTKLKPSSLAVCGLAYVFAILLLPKWGNYSIRQFLESCRTARKPRGLSGCRTLSSRSGMRRMMSTETLWIGKSNPLRLRDPAHSVPHSPRLAWDNNSLMIICEHIHYVSATYLSTSVHYLIQLLLHVAANLPSDSLADICWKAFIGIYLKCKSSSRTFRRRSACGRLSYRDKACSCATGYKQ